MYRIVDEKFDFLVESIEIDRPYIRAYLQINTLGELKIKNIKKYLNDELEQIFDKKGIMIDLIFKKTPNDFQ